MRAATAHEEAMEWVVLGTGTMVPHAERGCASHALVGDGVAALFDAGSGAKDRLARAGIGLDSVTHLVFSHTHLDHWADLLTLLFFRAYAPVEIRRPRQVIVGPTGFREHVRRVCDAADSALIERNEDLEWIDLAAGDVLDAGWFKATAWPMTHCDLRALGFRIEGGGASRRWSLAYSGDTEPCDSLVELSRGADCLVCECAVAPSDKPSVHMSPDGVRRVVDVARPGKLVLTHLYPEVLVPGMIERAFEGYEGEWLVASDGTRIALSGDQPPGENMMG